MQIESSNHSDEKTFSQSLKIEKENIICKDGFCSLPNQSKKSGINKSDVSLFEPI